MPFSSQKAFASFSSRTGKEQELAVTATARFPNTSWATRSRKVESTPLEKAIRNQNCIIRDCFIFLKNRPWITALRRYFHFIRSEVEATILADQIASLLLIITPSGGVTALTGIESHAGRAVTGPDRNYFHTSISFPLSLIFTPCFVCY